MFGDVEVKFQAQMCLRFDVEFFEHALFPRIITNMIKHDLPPVKIQEERLMYERKKKRKKT